MYKIQFLALLLLFTTSFTFIKEPPGEMASFTEYLLHGDWENVYKATDLEGAMGVSPSVAIWVRGYAALATNRYLEATALFTGQKSKELISELHKWTTGLVALHPTYATPWMLKGSTLLLNGETEDALASVTQAAEIAPDDALIRNVRGIIYFMAGNSELALDEFQEALRLDPEFTDALVNQGLIMLYEGNGPEATELLSKAIDLAPGAALAFNARGVAFTTMEAWQNAYEDFTSASKLLLSNQSIPQRNMIVLDRLKSQSSFRRSRWVTELNERGTTILAQAADHRTVDLGYGRTIDAFILEPTQQSTSLDGARNIIRGIADDLRRSNGLPDSWQPRIHIDAHGGFSTPIAQLDYAGHMAQRAGADVVVLLDLSSSYGRNLGTLLNWSDRMDDASMFHATVNAAVNRETGQTPTFSGFSAGAETFPRIGELLDRNELPKDVADNLGFENVVLSGYPFHDFGTGNVAVPDALQQRVKGHVYTFHTDPGHWSNRLQETEKVINIRVTDQQRKPISHTAWNEMLVRNRPNPIFELGSLALRGTDPQAIQELAGHRSAGVVTNFSVPVTQPISAAVSMARMTTRSMLPGDRVLIGSVNADYTTAMKNPLKEWPVKVLSTTNHNELQTYARNNGFTRILRVTGGSSSDKLTQSLLKQEETKNQITLSDVRVFRTNLSRFNRVHGDLEKLINSIPEVPDEIKNTLKLSGAIAEDYLTIKEGRFQLKTSHTLETLVDFGLETLPKIANHYGVSGRTVGLDGITDMVKATATYSGRTDMGRRGPPSLDEVTSFLDGFNKASWAIVGYVVTLGRTGDFDRATKFSQASAAAADLTALTVRGATYSIFESISIREPEKQVAEQWLTHYEHARESGIRAIPFTKMYPEMATKIGTSNSHLTDMDALAHLHNQNLKMKVTQGVRSSVIDGGRLHNQQPTQPLRFERNAQPTQISGFDLHSGGMNLPQQPPIVGRQPFYQPPHSKATQEPQNQLPSLPIYTGPNPGGVLLGAEVVRKDKADFSSLFGSKEKENEEDKPGLFYAPFLLFAAYMSH